MSEQAISTRAHGCKRPHAACGDSDHEAMATHHHGIINSMAAQTKTSCEHVTQQPITSSSTGSASASSSTAVEGSEVKGLEGMDIQRVGDVNYFQFSLSPDMALHQQRVKQLQLRPDDVITVGFPRSGNHWTFEVVNMIIRQSLEFEKDHFYSRLLEYQGENIYDRLDSISSPRNLTTHYRLHHLPALTWEKHVRVIYVMRNPKDVLVSLYNFSISLAYERSRFSGSWSQFFDLQMSGQFPWGTWFDHVTATERFMQEHPDLPIYVLVYERLKNDPVSEIRKLCRFLGSPETLVEDIARATEFSHMKSVLGKSKMAEQVSKHFKNGENAVLRTGMIGGWKDWFSESQSEAFDRVFQDKMGQSKLGELVRVFF